jgi:ATP-binding protein involved in chromosome partitioning
MKEAGMTASPTLIERIGDKGLRIVWDDGHESLLQNQDLRFACSCAVCIDEITGVRKIRREDIPADIRPTGLQLVGHYAVQIDWSDGHATGIYTYERLRSLCSCAECARRRTAPRT